MEGGGGGGGGGGVKGGKRGYDLRIPNYYIYSVHEWA